MAKQTTKKPNLLPSQREVASANKMEDGKMEQKIVQIKGYGQLKAIIEEIMEQQQKACSGHGFPSWDFLNGVLSCKAILGDKQLWFWWGDLRIVENDKQTKAGDMKILEDWNTEKDGTITLIGRSD